MSTELAIPRAKSIERWTETQPGHVDGQDAVRIKVSRGSPGVLGRVVWWAHTD